LCKNIHDNVSFKISSGNDENPQSEALRRKGRTFFGEIQGEMRKSSPCADCFAEPDIATLSRLPDKEISGNNAHLLQQQVSVGQLRDATPQLIVK
jgi:hypothetical protein